jgi:hypothetical protein
MQQHQAPRGDNLQHIFSPEIGVVAGVGTPVAMDGSKTVGRIRI